jgi:hypothetical protein
MNGYPKVAEIEKFSEFLNAVCSGLQKPVYVVISGTMKTFYDSSNGIENPFQPKGPTAFKRIGKMSLLLGVTK